MEQPLRTADPWRSGRLEREKSNGCKKDDGGSARAGGSAGQ